MTHAPLKPQSLSAQEIFKTWWPLAAGWLLMTAEIPMLAAIVARQADPKIHLAAWGIAFPLVLILGSPVMMMLAASTTLSKDWDSYLKLRRFMFAITSGLTILFVLLAFGPLFDVVVIQLMGVPSEVIEPTQLGFQLMIPWLGFLAYRRFNYGVLIRNGQSGAITIGVIIRLSTDVLTLLCFSLIGTLPGIVFAAGTMTIGVISEGIYSGWRVRQVLPQVKAAPPVAETLTTRSILDFYIPLALTSLLQVLMQPILSAALSRMPNPLESLAVWPVVFGLLILFTSAGMAYTEVVVVSLDKPQSLYNLRRFTTLLSGVSAGLLLLLTATPLAGLWFEHVAALPPSLLPLAQVAIWLVLPIPGFRVLQSWYQGVLMHSKRTRAITESVVLFLIGYGVFLMVGINLGSMVGLYVGVIAYTLSDGLRVVWLWFRARPSVQAVAAREGKAGLLYSAS